MMHFCYGDGRGPRETQPGTEADCPRCAERAYQFAHPTQVNAKTLVRELFHPLADEWVETANPAAVQAAMRRIVVVLARAVDHAPYRCPLCGRDTLNDTEAHECAGMLTEPIRP